MENTRLMLGKFKL